MNYLSAFIFFSHQLLSIKIFTIFRQIMEKKYVEKDDFLFKNCVLMGQLRSTDKILPFEKVYARRKTRNANIAEL